MIIIGQNTLSAENSYQFYSPFFSLGDLIEQEDSNQIIRNKYPDKADLLYCMWGKESTFGQDKRRGDHGLAVGPFQIHIDKHPITEQCALDFECALSYAAKSIQEGYGWWWSSYQKCGGL